MSVPRARSTSSFFSQCLAVFLFVLAALSWQSAEAAVPGSPTGLQTLATGANAVSLTWTAPVGASPAVSDYLVEYKATSSPTWLTFNDGVSAATGTTVTGLASTTVYNFRVSAVNASGTSTPGTVASSLYPEIASIPNLIAFWDFSEAAGGPYLAKAGTSTFPLINAGGSNATQVASGPFSGASVSFNGSNQYLYLASSSVGDLNLSKFGNNATVFAVVNRNQTGTGFIGGMWQEDTSAPERQYGLFTSLPTYGANQTVAGQISKLGGATPGGYPYSKDLSANISPITNSSWRFIAMTYDGAAIRSYYNARFEPYPVYTEPGSPNGFGLTYSKNPYVYTDGLNNTSVADFTVGANKLTGGPSNYFQGQIAGIGVVAGALSTQQIFNIQQAIARINATSTYTYDFNNSASDNTGISMSSEGFNTLVGSAGTDTSTSSALTNGFVLYSLSGNQFVIRQNTTAAGPSFWYDSQSFGIPIASLLNMSISLNDASTADTVKLAVEVGSQWYATDQSFSVINTGSSGAVWTTAETKVLSFERTASRWRKLTVTPGSALSIASSTETTDLPSSAVVNAFGVYSPSTPVGYVRFDNLSINTTLADPAAPVNVTAATTTGSVVLGGTVTVYPGTWTASPAPTYTYQWLRNGTAISGATSTSYTIGVSDSGNSLSAVVTATNASGSASSTTQVSASVPSGTAPSNTVVPSVTGTSTPGSVLAASAGTWSGSPSPTYTYQWQRGGVNILNASSSSYTVTSDDIGFSLHVVVTATNIIGSAQAQSVDLPISIAWTPLNLGSALQGWYDASDGTTVTITGTSSVTTWSDKSQKGRTLFSTSTASRPARITSSLNGLATINFNGVGNYLIATTSLSGLFRNVTGSTIAAVVVPLEVGVLQRPINVSNGLSSSSGRHGMLFSATNQLGTNGRRLDSDSIQDISSPNAPSVSSGTAMIAQSVVNNASSTSMIRRDGTAYSTTTFQTAGSTSDTDPLQITIGAGGGIGQFLQGKIGEFILVNGALSVTDQQNVDGYFANKWGLTGVLPSGHPYKNAAPITGPYVPATPLSLTASSSDSSVSLSWTVPTSNGGSSITDYQVQYKPSATSTWLTFNDGVSTSTSATVTGLSNGTPYDFSVAAVNSVGTGSFSLSTSSTPVMAADTIPPVVTITSPASGSTVSGSSVAITATSSDNIALAGVRFYVDGVATSTVISSAPFILTLDSTSLSNASHSISAVAEDTSGNYATSTITVTVLNLVPPTVASSAATSVGTSSATLNGSISSDGYASSTSRGFSYGTTTSYGQTSSTTGTYGVGSFSASISSLLCGTPYHYRAFAANAAGTGTSTDATFVTSACPDTTPPSVVIISPASGSTVSGSSVAINATSTDNVAVAGVTFYANGTKVGSEVTSAPYSVSWNSMGVASGTVAIMAVSRDTSSNYATATESVQVDNQAPVISAVASSTSQTTATISWSTDEAASSTVSYGASAGYGSASTSAALVRSHSIVLSGLSPLTLYHFQVSSSDAYGNAATSSDLTLTTHAVPDTTPPVVVITSPAGGSTVYGSSVALVATSTDNVAVAGVTFYANGTKVGSEVTSAPYSVSWNSMGVASGTVAIMAVSRDTSSNYATATVSVTVDNAPPSIFSVASSTTPSSASVAWTTDEPSSSFIAYGTSPGIYSATAASSSLVTSHSFSLTSLSPSTRYYFIVVSSDAYGNTATSSEQALTTTATPDVTPPAVLMTSPAFSSAVSGNSVILAATSSDNVAVAGVTFYVDGVQQGTEVTSSPYSVSWNSLDALNGSHGTFAVARDTSNNHATSSTISFSVLNAGATPVSVSAAPSNTGALITWTTSALASSRVAYSADASYASTSAVLDASPRVSSHSVSLSSLAACSQYSFEAVSADAAGNSATSSSQSFTTTGCAGGAVPSSASSVPVTSSSGGSAALSDSGSTLTATAPAGFTSTSSQVVMQIKALDSAEVIGSLGKPSASLSAVGNSAFDMKVLVNNEYALDSFALPVTVVYQYSAGDISGLNESSLWIYHYHDGAWIALDDCSVNAAAKTVTCTTPSFSVFSLFGQPAAVTPPAPASGSVASTGGTHTASSAVYYGCTDPKALNYQSYAASKPSLCRYASASSAIGGSASMPVSSSATYAFRRDLQKGMSGADVRALQVLLVSRNSGPAARKLAKNGITVQFGSLTQAAVVEFQKSRKIIPASGYFGPKTRVALEK